LWNDESPEGYVFRFSLRPRQNRTRARALLGAALLAAAAQSARADDSSDANAAPQNWALHGQATFVEQYHPAFRSPYRGHNSLDPGSRGDETFDVTAYLGVRLWDGAEAWANGEIDQGFGLSDTLGVAGFPSGEAYKVGSSAPYPKLPRLFVRQTIDLGGDVQTIDPDINQLGGSETANRIVITLGKFAVTDVFDHITYTGDPRSYFLNWALTDLSTFDYAANAWGYTYGGAIEWYQDWWTLRAGLFDLSNVPNSADLEMTVGRQFQAIGELEERHTIFGQSGKVHLLGYFTHGRMGLFSDAIALSQATGQPADVSLVRHMHQRAGIGLTFEQQVTDDLGLFARFGYSDPSREPFEFIDADSAGSLGLSLSGKRWDRKDDTVGFAVLVNSITKQHAAYFNDGGLGILVGDGQLPHPGDERILETYYNLAAADHLWLTADYQFIANPAYNRDRGPVSVLGFRIHAQM
jgi:high affinity Mn2+ porin